MLLFVQKRFLLNNGSDEDGNMWWVPLTYTHLPQPDFFNTTPSHWLRAKPQLEIHLDLEPRHWIVFNIQQTGNIPIRLL